MPAELDAERLGRAAGPLRGSGTPSWWKSPADAEETPDPENLGEVAADLAR
ncbi:hypothetical protein LV779_11870 [Streptomyces thinghirensis]|nr:hypothetical protein [Streptomyces thinghirensis]